MLFYIVTGVVGLLKKKHNLESSIHHQHEMSDESSLPEISKVLVTDDNIIGQKASVVLPYKESENQTANLPVIWRTLFHLTWPILCGIFLKTKNNL